MAVRPGSGANATMPEPLCKSRQADVIKPHGYCYYTEVNTIQRP